MVFFFFFAVGKSPVWEKEVPGSTRGHCQDIHGAVRDFGSMRRSLDRVWTFPVTSELLETPLGVVWIWAGGFGLWDL